MQTPQVADNGYQLPHNERVLSRIEFQKKLNVGNTKCYELIKEDPAFPKPIRIGKRAIGFLESEANAYLASLAAARG